MSNSASRRSFLKRSVWLTGAALLPGWVAKASGIKIQGVYTPGPHAPKVIDKEICFVNDAANKAYRPMPDDPRFRYFSGVPDIKLVQPVPFSWGLENFYSENGGYLTDNVYVEPRKPWILQLANSTPGKSDSAAGSPQYKIWYRTSDNGGKTFSGLKQVIIKGYTGMNPIPDVEIGRNGFNVDFTRPVVRASNGDVMVPVCLHPWDKEGKKIYLPVSKAGLFQDVGVLIAKWLPDGSDVEWNFGKWLRIDYHQSTRGLSEPTIVETREPGKFAMVTRCSNSGQPDLPGYARISFSDDYCRTWSAPRPFTYSDGSNFFVPTAHSTIIKSRKDGRVYWIGNLTETNPQGSFPRFPLVIGEVDQESFGLIKNTVTIIDTRHPEADGPLLQLSNFKVMENVAAKELLIVCTRREGRNVAAHPSWYRVKL